MTYGMRFFGKNLSHTWKNFVLPHLLLDYKFIEVDKSRDLVASFDEVNDELHNLY